MKVLGLLLLVILLPIVLLNSIIIGKEFYNVPVLCVDENGNKLPEGTELQLDYLGKDTRELAVIYTVKPNGTIVITTLYPPKEIATSCIIDNVRYRANYTITRKTLVSGKKIVLTFQKQKSV
ncbi:MAG: hypothetical protein LBE09_07810 [Christensenellaceae bacterium]|jgi:hypothetical protein|nr:hypothetical protein [Christensenellaceae bacterium]